jgi:predicted permease
MIPELFRRIRYYLRRGSFERDLEEEMRHHLALKAERNPAGAPFGNLTLLREDSRAMWNWNFYEQLAQDVRYALRAMRASPLFTTTAILSLALGIGANTAIYSFMDAILLRALPVPHPEELVIFHWRAPKRPAVVRGINGSSRGGPSGMTSPNFPYAAFDLFSAKQDLFSTVFGYAYSQSFNLVIHDQASTAVGVPVTGTFCAGLGIPPAAGRLLDPSDDRPGAPLVAVLTYDYWQRRFGGNPSIIGQSIVAGKRPITVVGVTSPGFYGLNPGARPDLFFPIHALSDFALDPAADSRQRFFEPRSYWLEMTARLRPGVTLTQAQIAIAGQFRQYTASLAATSQDRAVLPEVWLEPGASGLDSLRNTYSQPLHVLMAMVAIILTIACANLANLLLARSAARRREIAVRLSLGAGRARIVRQLLTETVMLSLLGGAGGVAFGYWGIQSITWLIANGRANFTLYAHLNAPVLAFTSALSVITGLAFGLAPALQATRLDLTPSLRAGKSADPAGPRRWIAGFTATRALLIAQIAMSLLLVIGAAVFVRNLVNLNAIDLGFNRDQLLVFSLNPRQAGYKGEATARFLGQVEDRIREIPGVRDVGLSSFPLVSRFTNSTGLESPHSDITVNLLSVDEGFLRTLQIPIMLGRGLEHRDITTPAAVVVSQKFSDTVFPNQNPLGLHFALQRRAGDFEIVGVARNAHYNSIEEDARAVVYLPFTCDVANLTGMYFNIRTAGNPMNFVGAIREIVRQQSPTVLMTSVNTESRIIDQTIGQQRTFADLGACFAGLALVIACVGLYGAMAYAVARRTGEIGIRMALGAQRRIILWMVMREVLVVAAIGLAVGYYIARQTGHWIESFLFAMKPNDATATLLAIAILFVAALMAGFAPAWRASRIHPMTALRNE